MKSVWVIALSILGSSAAAFAEDRTMVWDEASVQQDWQRAVRDFRRDHNFTLTLGQTVTRWEGELEGGYPIDTETRASELGIRYAFHIPWGYGFGYSLGTSASVLFAEEDSELLELHYRASLPGLDGGIVWNMTDRWRWSVGATYGWERVDGVKYKPDAASKRSSLTEESFSYRTSIDYFYLLTWAIRFEYEETQFPGNASQGHDLQKSILRYRIGVLKHLL